MKTSDVSGNQPVSPQVLELLTIAAAQQMNYASTLSSSDTQLEVTPLSSDTPILPATITAQFETDYNKIILDMLDKWIASIQADEDRVEEELRSPRYQAYIDQLTAIHRNDLNSLPPQEREQQILTSPAYLSWIASLSASQKAEYQITPQFQQQVGAIVGLSDFEGRVADHEPDAVAALSFMATAVVLMTTFAGQPVKASDEGSVTGPSQTLFDIQNNALSALHIDQTTLLTINLMLPLAAIYRPTMDVIDLANDPEQVSLAAAKSYAGTVLNMVSGTAIDNWAKATLVGQTDNEVSRQIAVTKIVMLATPLALLYKLESGGAMTSQEFQDLINNKIELPEGDMRRKLVEEINKNLAALSSSDQSTLLSVLGSDLENTDLQSLIQPNLTLASVYADLTSAEKPIADR